MKNMTIGQIQEIVENPGQPIRQPAVALLCVDTADRVGAANLAQEPSSVNNVYINTQSTLMQGFFTRVALTELNMNWAIPNVNAYNNTFTITGDATGQPWAPFVITSTVPENFYEPSDLATALAAAVNADLTTEGIPLAFACTFDPVLQRFTVSMTRIAPFAGAFEFAVVPEETVAKDDLCYMMGFGKSSVSTTVQVADTAGAIISNFASMLYTPYIDIVSQNLTKKQNMKDNSTSRFTGNNLLARIYITKDGFNPTPASESDILGVKPFSFHREFQNPKQIFWDTKEFLNVIDLQLRDYKGRILYEQPTLTYTLGGISTVEYGTKFNDYQMTFQITET